MGVKVYGSGVGHSPAKNVGVQSLWGLSDGLFGYLGAITYHYRYCHCDNNLTAKPYPSPAPRRKSSHTDGGGGRGSRGRERRCGGGRLHPELYEFVDVRTYLYLLYIHTYVHVIPNHEPYIYVINTLNPKS